MYNFVFFVKNFVRFVVKNKPQGTQRNTAQRTRRRIPSSIALRNKTENKLTSCPLCRELCANLKKTVLK